MSNRRFMLPTTAALVASVLLTLSARAGDAPPERKPIPKIENAFLDSLVGSWDVTLKGIGMEGAGVSRVQKAAGGTTLVQESQVTVAGRVYSALNVIRVDETGKGVRLWRCDPVYQTEMMLFQGALGEDGFEVKSDVGMALRIRKADSGFTGTILRDAAGVYELSYRKSAKEVEFTSPNAPKEGLRPAMIGAWDVVGEWTMPGQDGKPATIKVTGTSTFRWTLGGLMILHDYERATPMGPVGALGLHRSPADGSSTKVWWFEADQVDPMIADGPSTETAWHGKGTMPDGTTMGLEWARKGDGFEMRYEMAGHPSGSETYTKKK